MKFLLSFSIFLGLSTASAVSVVEKSMPFPGKLFVPGDGKAHVGLLIFHGSEGGSEGISYKWAELFAKRGVAALALCYFGCEGTPKALKDVDLSKSYEALNWLKRSKYVGTNNVALFGISRGAEHALLLASLGASRKLEVQPAAVAVHASTNIVVPAFFPEGVEEECIWPQPYCANAWRWAGEYKDLFIGQKIKVSAYKGKVLLSHGDQDEIWSVDMSRDLAASLKRAGNAPILKIWPGEGHVLSLPSAQGLLQLVEQTIKH